MPNIRVICAADHPEVDAVATDTEFGGVRYLCPTCYAQADVGHRTKSGLAHLVEEHGLQAGVSLSMLNAMLSRFSQQLKRYADRP